MVLAPRKNQALSPAQPPFAGVVSEGGTGAYAASTASGALVPSASTMEKSTEAATQMAVVLAGLLSTQGPAYPSVSGNRRAMSGSSAIRSSGGIERAAGFVPWVPVTSAGTTAKGRAPVAVAPAFPIVREVAAIEAR